MQAVVTIQTVLFELIVDSSNQIMESNEENNIVEETWDG